MKVNISLLQNNINAGDFKGEFEKVISIIDKIEILDNHFLLLPELWISGYSFMNMGKVFKFIKGHLNELQAKAKDKFVNIIGSVPWEEKNNLYNRTIIIDYSGKIKGYYDKIHLFKPLSENKYFNRGNNIFVTGITDFLFGVMLCYDIRFPELAKKLMLKGSRIIFVSAEWPLERIEHWILLNRARAAENQLFIAACNRVGESFGIKFGGNSLIVNPKGEILCQMGDKEGITTFEIDLAEVDKARQLFNIKDDTLLF